MLARFMRWPRVCLGLSVCHCSSHAGVMSKWPVLGARSHHHSAAYAGSVMSRADEGGSTQTCFKTYVSTVRERCRYRTSPSRCRLCRPYAYGNLAQRGFNSICDAVGHRFMLSATDGAAAADGLSWRRMTWHDVTPTSCWRNWRRVPIYTADDNLLSCDVCSYCNFVRWQGFNLERKWDRAVLGFWRWRINKDYQKFLPQNGCKTL